MILNITLPSIVKNHDLSSFEQAVAVKNQNEKCSIQYSITAEKTKPVVPEKTWNEPFAWLRTIYPIYRDQQKQTLSDQLIALVQEPKDNQELIISLLNDKKQELATADLKHLLYFAAQEGKIKVVQALTSLDGDLTLNHKILWYGLRSAVASKQFYCVDHFFNMASEKKYLLTQKEVDTLLQSITSAGFVANIKLDWPLAIHIMERAHPLALLSEETLQDITIRAKDQGVYDTLPECFKEPYSPNEPPHFKCG